MRHRTTSYRRWNDAVCLLGWTQTFLVSNCSSDLTEICVWVRVIVVCVDGSFSLIINAFLYRFNFPYVFPVCFIIFDTSSVSDFESFNDILSNTFRASHFGVFPVFALSPLSGWTVLTGMMYAIFDIEVIIGNHQCFSFHKQKQSSGGVLRKRCSENMQQIYRKTSMSKCDFNKVAGVPL